MTRPLLAIVLGAAMILASRAQAWADIPTVHYGPVVFTGAGALPVINLSGQSSCSMTMTGSGSGDIDPMGSSDGGVSYHEVGSIGEQTTNGTFGGSASPYLTNFYVSVVSVTGSVSVSETCSPALPTSSGGVLTCAVVSASSCTTNFATFGPKPCLGTWDGPDTTTTAPLQSIVFSNGTFTLTLGSSDTGTIAVYYNCP